ncbi:MAG: hypothetical protein N3D84_02415 [Candidatus Woesearchaeota archaeon]|nr:hypothetical protein [Candidatus Woesearchaeota archaeon]
MSEADKVIKLFKKTIDKCVAAIEKALKEKDIEKIKFWYAEILRMRNTWKEAYEQPSYVAAAGTWGSGFRITDTGSTKELAKIRLDYAENALREIDSMLQKAGIKIA